VAYFFKSSLMQVGDTVIIKSTGRRALITAELPEDHFQVEYLPDPAEDPIERDSPPPDEGGIYIADELQPPLILNWRNQTPCVRNEQHEASSSSRSSPTARSRLARLRA
jgi:hypothetical protein